MGGFRMFYVDEEWVGVQKKAATAEGEVPFVSTNDIITSWFFRKVGASAAIMAINLRGRVAGAEDHIAGNYESGLVYRPADFATPALIRKSLAKLRRAASPPTSLPSAVEHMRGFLGRATNWSTFARPVELPGGAAQSLHIPVTNLGPTALPPNVTGMIIFRANSGRLACCVTGPR